MTKNDSPEVAPDLSATAADIAAALRELTEEIKAMHTTLKAIARSQALMSTKQQGKSGG